MWVSNLYLLLQSPRQFSLGSATAYLSDDFVLDEAKTSLWRAENDEDLHRFVRIYNLFCGFPALLHCDSNSVFHGIAKHQRRDTIPSSDGWSGCFTSAEILSDARTSNCGHVVLWCGNRTLRYFILTAAMVKDFVQQQKYYCWSGIEREHQWGCDKLEKRAPTPAYLRMELHDQSCWFIW